MGEVAQGSGGGDKAQADRNFLFIACFVALVATSFAFVLRTFMVGAWQIDFGLSETQKGEIMGAGFWSFGLSIVLFSLVVDKLGYGKSMIVAFACHVASVVLFFMAWGYWPLWIGSFLSGLAAGVVEAVINPAIATAYPKAKTKWLTLLHAGWPAGIVLNGIIILLFMDKWGVSWRPLVFVMLIPVVAYGIMILKAKFPVSERVEAGVSYKGMLEEAGALSCLIVVYMLLMQINALGMNWFGMNDPYIFGIIKDTTFFDVPSVMISVLIVASTVAYFIYTKSLGRWMYVFLLVVMILLATTELGTDGWMKELLAGWILLLSATIMMILRFLIGPIQKGLTSIHKSVGSPLGILLVSSLFAAVGLFMLPRVIGALVVVFAVIYGTGQCFFWPVTIGLVAERFPKGGALTINAVAGVGMLGCGIVGMQLMGFWNDTSKDRTLQAKSEVAYVRLMSEEPKQSLFGSYKPLNQTAVNKVNDLTKIYEDRGEAEDVSKLNADPVYQTLIRNTYDHLVRAEGDAKVHSHEEMHGALEKAGHVGISEADYNELKGDQKLLGVIGKQASRDVMTRVAVLPIMMAVCYLGLMLYFRSKGGYKQVELAEGEGAPTEAKAEAQA
ncbi:MAG: MFS transporter [Planctomycetota bacterium]